MVKDDARAFALATAGHAAGSAIATGALARCKFRGVGCPSAPLDAALLYRQAVDAGEPLAMSGLVWTSLCFAAQALHAGIRRHGMDRPGCAFFSSP